MYLSDRQGVLLAMSNPISGNHHDLFDIEIHFEEVTSILDEAKISIEGLFMNFDAGFDAELYKECYAIERSNALGWIVFVRF